MTNFNFLSKFNNWLGELSSRMSLVGVSYDASGAKVAREWLNYVAVLLLVIVGVGNVWGTTYTYDFTKGSSTSYWTSDNSSTSVGTSNIESFYYMQSGYSGHHFTAGNGSTNTHNHRFNTTNGQQCFFLGKTNEYLNLPTYSGEKITSVQIYGNGQGSASANLNIYSGSTAVSTAAAIQNTNNTFSINSSYQNTALTVKVTNNYNAGISKIVITTESAASCSGAPTVAAPNKGSFNWT